MLTEKERVNPTQVYKIGIADSRWDPAETEVKDMLYLIAYDISTIDKTGQRRLRQVAKTCENYGIRVEKSVFECDLKEEVFAAFWDSLNKIIDPDEDSLIAYRICRSCVKDVLSAGALYRPIKRLAYIF
jgi:CRISPR-associated protein Cas2